jgi:anti-sigma regulatory factor (Ser/Thr protein kinase)
VSGETDDMRFTAIAEPRSLGSLRRWLTELLESVAAPEDVRFEAMLAVSEAANNVLQHAFRHRSAPGRLAVTATLRDGEIRIVVSDDGGGLAPRSHSPGAGLGLPLMAQLSDDLVVANREDGGTAVTMTWSLAA